MTITITDQNRTLWQQRLSEAETALSKLMTGVAVVELSFDGETVKYTGASENKLRRWINEINYSLGNSKRPRAASRQVSFR